MKSPGFPVLSRPSPFIPVPAPLKHRVYPFRMTVCIAAICQKNGAPRILLCSDMRMSAGDYGSTDNMMKLHGLGRGWTAQAARRPDSASELIERVREWFRVSPGFSSVHSVVSSVNAAVSEFEGSPLYEKNCCELLISGFVLGRPVVIVVAGNDKGKLTVRLAGDYFAVGSGATIATVIMNCREYHSMEHYEQAMYMVYEAKRLSEQADGVGPQTRLLWIAPLVPGGPIENSVGFVTGSGLAYLESKFQKSGLRADIPMDDFPDDFTQATPPDPPPTTDAP